MVKRPWALERRMDRRASLVTTCTLNRDTVEGQSLPFKSGKLSWSLHIDVESDGLVWVEGEE